MDERFVSLATYLRATSLHVASDARCEDVADAERPASVATASDRVASIVDFARADIVEDLTIMRIAAMEAFERRARRLITELARDVLVRELALAPVDIEALVADSLGALADYEPIALGIASVDRGRIRTPLPLREDPELVAGDLIVYVRDGAFESTFEFRLAAAIESDAARGER